jgi:pimeloyl-ACP methyl ester carboxylesterase
MSNTALILVPGLLCNDYVWEPQIRDLSPLASITVADHGALDSIEAMAQAVIEKAPAKFAIAGHSMGGRVTMEVVRRVPDRVLGAALLDCGAYPRRSGEAGEREKEHRYKLLAQARSEGMRAMGWTWLQDMIHPSRRTDRALTEGILDMICTKTPEIFEAQIRALLERPDARPVLGRMPRHTLILCGNEDLWATVRQHREMAEAAPGSTLVVVPECGHMSTLEKPEEVTQALRVWLQSVVRGSA